MRSLTSGQIRFLDNLERFIVLAFYLQLLVRMVWSAYQNSNPAALIQLPGESLIVVLLLIRRRAEQMSIRWQDWLAAVVCSILPTLVAPPPTTSSSSVVVIAAFLALVGLIVQLHAKLALGRSFGVVAANRGVKSRGPYQFIRHPMYAGYLIGHLAFIIVSFTSWNLLLLISGLLLQLYRIRAEEHVLSQDPQYLEYMQRVRHRIVPGLI